jgi:DNA primase
MPGVDFMVVRTSIAMAQVLEWIGFESSHRSGDQWHGPCPIHRSRSDRSRSFSVNIATYRYKCHRGGSSGNQIELWAAVHHLTVYEAAVDLCRRANISVPWISRW